MGESSRDIVLVCAYYGVRNSVDDYYYYLKKDRYVFYLLFGLPIQDKKKNPGKIHHV